MHKFHRCLLALVSMLALFPACSEQEPENAPPSQPQAFETQFNVAVGSVPVAMQIAIETSEQRVGLMHRQSIPDGYGMLFLYRQPQTMSFWMKNTLIPLDIAFFSPDGTLREIRRMAPHDLSATTSSSGNIQFALETNQGWLRSNGIKSGDKLDLSALTKALEARGYEPTEFGLGTEN